MRRKTEKPDVRPELRACEWVELFHRQPKVREAEYQICCN
jgi:hypothetical protein